MKMLLTFGLILVSIHGCLGLPSGKVVPLEEENLIHHKLKRECQTGGFKERFLCLNRRVKDTLSSISDSFKKAHANSTHLQSLKNLLDMEYKALEMEIKLFLLVLMSSAKEKQRKLMAYSFQEENNHSVFSENSRSIWLHIAIVLIVIFLLILLIYFFSCLFKMYQPWLKIRSPKETKWPPDLKEMINKSKEDQYKCEEKPINSCEADKNQDDYQSSMMNFISVATGNENDRVLKERLLKTEECSAIDKLLMNERATSDVENILETKREINKIFSNLDFDF